MLKRNPERWSFSYKRCRDCLSTEFLHQANGRCVRCFSRHRRAHFTPEQRAAAKRKRDAYDAARRLKPDHQQWSREKERKYVHTRLGEARNYRRSRMQRIRRLLERQHAPKKNKYRRRIHVTLPCGCVSPTPFWPHEEKTERLGMILFKKLLLERHICPPRIDPDHSA